MKSKKTRIIILSMIFMPLILIKWLCDTNTLKDSALLFIGEEPSI